MTARPDNSDPPTTGSDPAATRAVPRLDAVSLEASSDFVASAGLVVDQIGPDRVAGHIELDSRHHTPWGIVHGGVYSSALESAASIGATTAVAERGQVAVGLTNTTHFLRSLSAGRVVVEAVALYQGRTHQLWRADVTDGSGRLVAHGEVRLQNVVAEPEERTGSAAGS
jgi:1,4-dihydroxy-2-naphthoyl-CoA hydrolase